MKEFLTKRGGRYLFNEDFDNLQDTIKAIALMFKDCGLDFIISGCDLDGNYLNGGYVFLDGYIRKVEKTDVSGLQPPYCICAYDVEYKRSYKNGVNNTVAVDYKTQVVAKSSDPTSAYIESDENGVFSPIIDTFWNHYLVVDNNKKQNFGQTLPCEGVRAKNLTLIGTNYNIESYIKDDGTFVLRCVSNSDNSEVGKVEVGPSGLPISFYNSEGLKYQIGTKEGTIDFIILLAYAINGKTIDAAQYLLNDVDIHDLYFSQQEYIDTGWRKIINTSTNEEVDGFFARRILDIVYIQGTLPSDFIATRFPGNAYTGSYTTKYKLPDLSIDSDSYLPDELNFCHLHTIAFIGISSSLSGVIGSDHVTGCAVRLNSNGEFCIYQGKENGKAEGLYDNSLPIHNVRYDDRPIVDGLQIYEYDNAIRPHVSWKYAIDSGLVATNIRYAWGVKYLYNPAPGYVINGETYSGYIIHEHCFKNKYVNSGSGEYLEKTWRFTAVKLEYRLKTKRYYYDNWRYLRSSEFTYDTDWIEAPITYLKDYVDYRYYTSFNETAWEMRESRGIYFVNPGKNQYCEIRLTWHNDELGDYASSALTLENDPDCIVNEIWAGETSTTKINGKWTMTGLRLNAYEKYYYEMQSSYRSNAYEIWEGARSDNMTLEVIQGSEYVTLQDGKLIFTQAALTATSKMTITVRASLSYKGMPDKLLYKDNTIEIDPKYYTLQNE